MHINPDKSSCYEKVKLPGFITDGIIYIGNAPYICNESVPSYLYKINKDLNYSSTKTMEVICYGIFGDRENKLRGTYAERFGKLLATYLNLKLKKIYELLAGFNNVNEIAFDEQGDIYITCWESPAKIVKIRFLK